MGLRVSEYEPLVVVIGPTAVGKSAFAHELARRHRGAILNADAMQVYRGFDRGTAKPTADVRGRVPHSLVDIADPRRDFSAGDFVRAAEEALAKSRQAEMRPFLVGGSGLYIRCFLRGIFDGPRRQPDLRERLRCMGRRRGWPFLHRVLHRLDPEAASRISPADVQRIVRALEVRLVTGRGFSEHLRADKAAGWRGAERFQCVKIGLVRDREDLRRRIRRRVEQFFAAGLVEEIQGLLASGVPATANAFKGIGYREALGVIQGRMPVDEAIESTVGATGRYAKRQMTWFRRERNVHWIQAGPVLEETVQTAEAVVN